MLLIATPAHADPVARWAPLIAEASFRYGIPETWVIRIMRAESRGRTTLNGRPIRSVAGAMGLMQIMPDTWSELRTQLALGTDPDDPRDNILAGTFYLRRLYDRFGYPGLFAAYNAGPARYAAYLAGRRPLPDETVAYLDSVGSMPLRPSNALQQQARAASVFMVRRAASNDHTEQSTEQLFAIRRMGE